MKRLRVHVIYEHGADFRPYSSSHMRLLRPLTHPSLAPWLDVSSSAALCDDEVDVFAVDRLWREDLTAERAASLVREVRRRGAKLLYSLDDNLLARLSQPPSETGKLEAVKIFLESADRVLVSTSPLQELVREYNDRVSVISNYLDERLLPDAGYGTPEELRTRLAERRSAGDQITIGYMGTFTHDEDFRLVIPALKAVSRRHAGQITLEMVGGILHAETWSLLQGIPCRKVDPGPSYVEYPAFLPWFCGTRRWQIGLAPLPASGFNSYKSDIKFLDYAALGAAGIFSRVPVYERSVQNGITGWLADNTTDAWEAAIEHLVTHPVEALTIGWAGQRHLRQNRTLAQGSGLWLNAVRQAMAGDD